MMKFLKHFFKCNCNGKKEEPDNKAAMAMISSWNPYKVQNRDKLQTIFQRIFLSDDGQKALQHLTNLAFQESTDLSWNKGKQDMIKTIFDLLIVDRQLEIKYTK